MRIQAFLPKNYIAILVGWQITGYSPHFWIKMHYFFIFPKSHWVSSALTLGLERNKSNTTNCHKSSSENWNEHF